jgi:signal transduction histidine kinase
MKRLLGALRRQKKLWHRRAAATQEERRRIERWLATSRVFLAIAALFAMWFRAADAGSYTATAYVVVAVYFAFSVAVMLFFRYRRESSKSFVLLVHAADTIWPALIGVFSTARSSPFFLFFFFSLLAAAYRWGLMETLATGVAAVLFPVVEAFLLTHLQLVRVIPPELDASHLFERAIALLIMALLLGYLGEQQKQLRAEKTVITTMLSQVRVEAGMTATLQAVLRDIGLLYQARSVRIAALESKGFRMFAGVLADGSSFQWLNVSVLDREKYLFETPAVVWYAESTGNGWSATGINHEGTRLRSIPGTFAVQLGVETGARSMAGADFAFGAEWAGRIFLEEPEKLSGSEEELRFLRELLDQVGPAVYNVFLLRRLRQRAGAVERARVARELHDGAVQSLIAMEMQVDILRRQAKTQANPIAGELERIQGLLREEVLKLRELMQQMKSLNVDGKRLPAFLAETVERFQRETGIQARFLSDVEDAGQPPRVCRELARITQEALVNVRKHSQAKHVLVRLGAINGSCKLTVEDDGRGLDFTGRMSQNEMEACGKGPGVIKERVRFIDGELTIESNPGEGTRLEVSVTSKPESTYES